MSAQPAVEAADALVQSAWRDQARWSDTANRLKSELERWRLRALAAGVAGAALETAASTLHDLGIGGSALQPALAVTGAMLLAVVPVVLSRLLSKEKVSAWARCRAASERLKETLYRYLLAAPPFGPAPRPADLVARCQAIQGDVAALAGLTALTEPSTKRRPLSLDAVGYVAERVTGQIDGFYRRKAVERARSAQRLRRIELACALAAAALGVVAGIGKLVPGADLALLGPWVAVVAGLGASVTAHLAAARYDTEATLYAATAALLSSLRDRWQADPQRLDPAQVAALVDDCERAIATENGSWLAEWQRDMAAKA